MAGSDTRKEDDLLAEDKEAFEEAQSHEAENRNAALEDIRFARLGEQWPPAVLRQREKDGRPCLTINQLPAFIRQVVNDARQNKPGINVHPVDSQADPQTADILNGLIRHIEQSSDAEVAYDTALDFAVTGGFGYFKINTRYTTDDTFDQDLVIEQVANPFSIYGDPNSTAADSSDWMSAFEIDRMTKKAFEARWPDADAVDFDSPTDGDSRNRAGQDRVTIAARWVRDHALRKIVALTMPGPVADQNLAAQALGLVSDRLILDLEVYEENKDLFDAVGMSVMGQPRGVPSFKVLQRILSGADVLEEIDWAGKYIPVIPVYGEEVNVEGLRHFRGLVRDAKDPQRMFNYWRTTTTELVALAPRAPYIGEEGAFEVDREKWETVNTQNWPFLEFAKGKEPPERQTFQGVPAGALQEAMNASDDMKRIMGLNMQPVTADNESSGRAILARMKEGDIATFHFIDNLSRAIRHGGRVMLDLIPKVYSAQRVIRIVKPDGSQAAVMIGPQQQPEPQEAQEAPAQPIPVGAAPPQPPQPVAGALAPQMASQLIDLTRIYDLTIGTYDLTVQAGPAYSTLREELNTVLMELVRAYPPAAPAIMDLIVKTLDIPDAQEVAQRIQALAQGNPAAGKQAQQAQQAAQALQDAHNQIAELNQKLQMANFQMQMTKREADLRLREAALNNNELNLRGYEAQTDRIEATTDAARVQLEARPGPLHSPAA